MKYFLSMLGRDPNKNVCLLSLLQLPSGPTDSSRFCLNSKLGVGHVKHIASYSRNQGQIEIRVVPMSDMTDRLVLHHTN